jgi:hypothetical protein
MNYQDTFHRIQERAYEIYLHRDPRAGSADADWYEAELEIEREDRLPPHTGPARVKGHTRWSDLLTHRGEDIENPA